jgi:hypothetical protein
MPAPGDDAQTTEAMNGRSEDKPAKPAVKPDRAAREAAALRANLLKRKDQARRREEGTIKPER